MVMAIFAITMSSCQSQEDMPEAPVAPTASLESTFPAGSEVMNVNVNIQDDNRTRSGDIDLPLWDLFDGTRDDVLHVRYAVYSKNGVYYSTPDNDAEYVKISGKNFNLKVPFPADENNCSVCIWADKYGATSSAYSYYTIDWNARRVTQKQSYLTASNYSQKLDAFLGHAQLTKDENVSIILKRPFVQINLLSDEPLLNDALARKWEGYITSQLGFTSSENPDKIYVPKSYDFIEETLSFDVEPFGSDQTYTISIGSNDNKSLTNPFNGKGFQYATLFGRRMVYLGTWYYFAPILNSDWYDENSELTMDGLYIRLRTNSNSGASRVIRLPLPNAHQNERLVLYNGNGSETGPGIFTSEGTLNVLIDDAYEAENTESMM